MAQKAQDPSFNWGNFWKGFGMATIPAAIGTALLTNNDVSTKPAPPEQPFEVIHTTTPSPYDANNRVNFITPELQDSLSHHEGYKTKPYKDSLGYETVGIGHRVVADDPVLSQTLGNDWRNVLNTRELSDKEVRAIFMADAQKAQESVMQAGAQYGINVAQLPPVIRNTLIEMSFQMGSVSGFPNMMKAIADGNYKDVPKHMLDSQWFKSQTPKRAWGMAKRISDAYNVPMTVEEPK